VEKLPLVLRHAVVLFGGHHLGEWCCLVVKSTAEDSRKPSFARSAFEARQGFAGLRQSAAASGKIRVAVIFPLAFAYSSVAPSCVYLYFLPSQ